VKLLGVLYVSRHPKNLYKLYQLYGKPPSICQPPEDPLLLIKVESGLELSYDLLVPIVLKLHDVSGAMEITSLKNPIEGGILLLPHVVKVDPLHRDNWLGLLQKHGGIPTLMEKGLEHLIDAFFLGAVIAGDSMLLHYLAGVNLVLVDHLSIVTNCRSPHL
jgi:hypothetical protein